MVDLFRYTTVAALARYLESRVVPAAHDASVAVAETVIGETRARMAKLRATRHRVLA
jgi:hypothetical protein